ncbi:hypothetical protein BCR41DRAFT_384272 [Lobosporangium transversale]|uniref:Uncharacterized protein n=1 Tax=Lobosporangium transversale TaxID=64571 RepID=A0A1Y2GWP6_9FUNG|nr:hypothetical protein BCR41DRAFT_384272 [Lobosporangium transversale]ORZ26689.1 hypothetical protein BCR41DRAFT_384272 [Lobosporangium transversale]|eukprot:XP_021884452.1 hypothetical protein BCR41DRAFT_384272 [Lobosporangium transversale]
MALVGEVMSDQDCKEADKDSKLARLLERRPEVLRRMSFIDPSCRPNHSTRSIYTSIQEGNALHVAIRRHLQDIEELAIATTCEKDLLDALVDKKYTGTTTHQDEVARTCTHLKALRVANTCDEEYAEKVITLVENNPNLSELWVTNHVLATPPLAERLVCFLKTRASNLKEFKIHDKAGVIPLPTAVDVINACMHLPSLERLEISACIRRIEDMNMDYEGLVTLISKLDSLPPSVSPSIQALRLPEILPPVIQVPILKRCGSSLVEYLSDDPYSVDRHLYPYWTDHRTIIRAIHDHCPNVKQVVWDSFRTVWPIDGAPSVKDESFLKSLLDACDRSGLRSISSFLLSDRSLDALLNHRKTLKQLKFSIHSQLSASGFQQIMTSCEELRQLDARWPRSIWMPEKNRICPNLTFQALIQPGQQEWLCKKLQSLAITISMNVNEDDLLKYGGEAGCLEIIYSRIGALTELEELDIMFISSRGDEDEDEDEGTEEQQQQQQQRSRILPTIFSVDSVLKHLKHLKNLRRMSAPVDAWQGVGQAELFAEKGRKKLARDKIIYFVGIARRKATMRVLFASPLQELS